MNTSCYISLNDTVIFFDSNCTYLNFFKLLFHLSSFYFVFHFDTINSYGQTLSNIVLVLICSIINLFTWFFCENKGNITHFDDMYSYDIFQFVVMSVFNCTLKKKQAILYPVHHITLCTSWKQHVASVWMMLFHSLIVIVLI